MAKTVGIPDREHSELSSRTTARQDDGRARPCIPSRPAVMSRTQKAGHMTAPTTSPAALLKYSLWRRGRPHMTEVRFAQDKKTSRHLEALGERIAVVEDGVDAVLARPARDRPHDGAARQRNSW